VLTQSPVVSNCISACRCGGFRKKTYENVIIRNAPVKAFWAWYNFQQDSDAGQKPMM
jgi:hypothetical protein